MRNSIEHVVKASPLPNDSTAILYRIELVETQLADWIVKLSLLEKGYYENLLLISKNHSLWLELGKETGYPKVVVHNQLPKLILPSAQGFKAVLGLYLLNYRDGKNENDHLDITVYDVDKKLPYQRYYFTFS